MPQDQDSRLCPANFGRQDDSSREVAPDSVRNQTGGPAAPGGPSDSGKPPGLYVSAPGIVPARIQPLHHRLHRRAGHVMSAARPETTFTYTDFLHLASVSAETAHLSLSSSPAAEQSA
jgi:hypothetical protein